MAHQFSLVINSASIELLENLAFFLDRDTRPLFEEDVAKNDRALFLSIELLNYPACLRIEDKSLWLDWLEVDNFGIDDVNCILDLEGIELVIAFEVPDDPMSLDAEENCWFWIDVDGHLIRVNRKKALELRPEKIVNTFSGL